MPEEHMHIAKPRKSSQQAFWFKVLLTVVGSIALGISSWALNKTIGMVEAMAEFKAELKVLDEKIDRMKDDKAEETKQDTTLSKHWKLHSWTRDEISAIKHKLEMGETKWPEFEK